MKVIVIDTREQTPYRFEGMATRVGTLRTGDYSLEGFEEICAIERKSFADCLSSMSTGRKRFEREHHRLSQMRLTAVVVEATLEDIAGKRKSRSRMNRRAAVGTILSWSTYYRIPWFLVPNRIAGERVTQRLLTQWSSWLEEKSETKRVYVNCKA